VKCGLRGNGSQELVSIHSVSLVNRREVVQAGIR
jgi:hypothetical protein